MVQIIIDLTTERSPKLPTSFSAVILDALSGFCIPQSGPAALDLQEAYAVEVFRLSSPQDVYDSLDVFVSRTSSSSP